MNYALAKKLKEAKFPNSEHWIEDGISFISSCEEYDAPTLSELIEACGDELWKLERTESDIGGRGWLASVSKNNPKFTQTENPEDVWAEFGKTPEEAVANLWLELNKK